MEKIISCLAIAITLVACSKEALLVPTDQESSVEWRGGMTVTTDQASYILSFGVTSGGSVSSSGGGNNVTERGVCYSISSGPTIDDETVPSGSGPGAFTCILSGLNSSTTYYARAYANKISRKGVISTTYGNEVSFITSDPDYSTVTDNDGNTYTTIRIGTQEWMMENLKTTTYRDGTLIPEEEDDVLWADLSTGAYCNYNNNINNVDTYGRLYNWFAINDAHHIAPEGWHVPTTAEWQTLVNYVGQGPGGSIAGAKLKEAGFAHWDPPYFAGQEGNNSSGFTALGSGMRVINSDGTLSFFLDKKQRGNFWTANGSEENYYSDFVYLQSGTDAIMGSGFVGTGFDNHDPRCGYSVRLVKD